LDEELKHLDLSSKSFDEFVAFFFDREVVKLEPPNDFFVADFFSNRTLRRVNSLLSGNYR